MAHVADELDYERTQREQHPEDGLPRSDVPDIVNDKRQLRLVPWHGEGPDPLGEETAS